MFKEPTQAVSLRIAGDEVVAASLQPVRHVERAGPRGIVTQFADRLHGVAAVAQVDRVATGEV
ncbi:hypothetical protein ACV35P_34540, partial [Pseudomonas aeruginosa]